MYIIRLDVNDGDMLHVIDSNSWRSTLSKELATYFLTEQEALFVMKDLAIKSMHPDAVVQLLSQENNMITLLQVVLAALVVLVVVITFSLDDYN